MWNTHDRLMEVLLLLWLITAAWYIPTSRADDVDEQEEGRIVGGVAAAPREFDYFGTPNPFFCGAALIHPQVMLTAAHCECSYARSATEFILGSNQKLDRTQALDVVPITGARVIHPNYSNSDSEQNDILLIKLSRPANAAIQPVTWATSVPAAGSTVTAVGFGATLEGGSGSQTLLKVAVPVVSFTTCNSAAYYDGGIDSRSMLCAGIEGKDSCQGDSGGPLINTLGQVVGITSFGTGCARRNKPGVYTNVANYDNFIKQGICALADDRPSYCATLDYSTIKVRTSDECGPPGEVDDDCSDFLSCLLQFFQLIFCGIFELFG